MPADVAKTVHALARKLLSPSGAIREMLQLWVDGAYDEADDGELGLRMPDELNLVLGQMYLWPIVERWLEQPHSVMKRIGGFRHVGGAFCSLSVRFPRIMKDIADDPNHLKLLMEKFEISRGPKQTIKELGWDCHSLLVQRVDESRRASLTRQSASRRLRVSLGHAIYLTDSSLQYARKSEAAKQHKRLRDDENKVAANVCKEREGGRVSGYAALKQAVFRQHLQSLPITWFSLPSALLRQCGLTPLESHAGRHTAPRAPTAMEDDGGIEEGPSLERLADETRAIVAMDPASVFRVVDWNPSRL